MLDRQPADSVCDVPILCFSAFFLRLLRVSLAQTVPSYRTKEVFYNQYANKVRIFGNYYFYADPDLDYTERFLSGPMVQIHFLCDCKALKG